MSRTSLHIWYLSRSLRALATVSKLTVSALGCALAHARGQVEKSLQHWPRRQGTIYTMCHHPRRGLSHACTAATRPDNVTNRALTASRASRRRREASTAWKPFPART